MSSREVDFSLLTRAGYPIQEFDVGEVIFSDRDGGDYMFLVRSGSIEIMRHGAVVETVGPGGIFGEMALIDGSPRSATARVKEACHLIAIPEKGFLFMVHETPYFALDVMRILSERLRVMNQLV